MATQTEQQNALKDAMARAKEIAAKLGSGGGDHGGLKRGGNDMANEPLNKKPFLAVDHSDPKVIAQQVANSLAQRTAGPMFVEEMKVATNSVGLVIGKGGEIINKLQSDSGAKIQVGPEPPPGMLSHERGITITGPADSVAKAKSMITDIINKGKIPDQLAGGAMQGEFTAEMTVPKPKVGLIIGKGGETIKNLQDRSGCRLMLVQDGAYQFSPEKLLRITGEQNAVMFAKQLVEDILTSKEIDSINSNQRTGGPPMQRGGGGGGGGVGSGYLELQVPREIVGMVIGARGANVSKLQNETGCRIQFKNDMQGPTKMAILTGTPEQVAEAQRKINEIIESAPESRGPPNRFRGGGAPRQSDGPHRAGGGGSQTWPQQATSVQVPGSVSHQRQGVSSGGLKNMVIKVPAAKCGYVIGKGGENIRAIKTETKINMQLDRTVPDTSPIRVFRVSGSDEGIQQALEIIREKVQDRNLQAEPEDGSGATLTYVSPGAPGVLVAQPAQTQLHGLLATQQAVAYQQVAYQQPAQVQPAQAQQIWIQQQQPQPGQQQWQQQPPASTGNPAVQWDPSGAVQASSTAQVYQQSQTAATTLAVSADPQAAAALQPGTQEYNAAWAQYYQQQQLYQQYYAQQQSGAAASSVVSLAPQVTVVAAAPQVVSNDPSQAAALAQYQAQLAQYQTQYVQTPQ